ncbi:MAG: hypothetical protein KGD59_11965 [Candidatus Heimdallarchaeota archaeon]|nr:hypothetical protein [Candidatus Heimdallarchaeota archaeon]MBY8995259.1 hypothetical protein [Candidatus Heimdallarchaeota archaeon]
MADRLGFGWEFIGTILCGLIFAIPIGIAYFIVRFVQGRVEKRKEKDIDEHTVI